MNNEYLVAINLTIGKKIINPTLKPLLYYWNGQDDLYETLTKDEEIISIFKEACKNYDDYEGAKISYFNYRIEDEDYSEMEIRLEDIYGVDILNDSVWVDIVEPIFDYLYESAFSIKYVEPHTGIDKLQHIYDDIKIKYGDKVEGMTFVNYVRSKMDKQRTIESKNKDYIISRLSEFVK